MKMLKSYVNKINHSIIKLLYHIYYNSAFKNTQVAPLLNVLKVLGISFAEISKTHPTVRGKIFEPKKKHKDVSQGLKRRSLVISSGISENS